MTRSLVAPDTAHHTIVAGTRGVQIALPRHDGESAQAYEARVTYVTMGADRSLVAVAHKLRKSATIMGRWSAQYRWQESARMYDDQIAAITIQEAAERHKQDIETHRADAMRVSGELIALARQLVEEIAARRSTLEYRPGDLATVAKAIELGFNLRAHALDLPRLLAQLEADTTA